MFKKLLLLTAILVVAFAMTSAAKDLTGRFGLGYYDSDAPVGIRYWVNEKVGIDVGVGFQIVDGITEINQTQTDTSVTTGTQFIISAGVPYVVYPTDRANFMVRPGLLFISNDEKFADSDQVGGRMIYGETEMYFTAHLVAEVFFGDHFSLQASHGINISMISDPFDGSDDLTNFGTASGSISELGFHFYF